jgi:hypothetical protein
MDGPVSSPARGPASPVWTLDGREIFLFFPTRVGGRGELRAVSLELPGVPPAHYRERLLGRAGGPWPVAARGAARLDRSNSLQSPSLAISQSDRQIVIEGGGRPVPAPVAGSVCEPAAASWGNTRPGARQPTIVSPVFWILSSAGRGRRVKRSIVPGRTVSQSGPPQVAAGGGQIDCLLCSWSGSAGGDPSEYQLLNTSLTLCFTAVSGSDCVSWLSAPSVSVSTWR